MQDPSRVAVVTGGTTGIGLAVVDRLLADGFRVAWFGSDPKKLEASVAEISKRAPDERIFARRVDLRDPDLVCSFIEDVGGHWDGISVLVNNAGISPKRNGRRIPLHETSLNDWEHVVSINLTGAFVCAREVIPGMITAGYGRIINIGSIAGRTLPRLAGAPYAASKAAMAGLTRSIASEYSRFGITANTVSPGNVASDMTGDVNSPANRAAAKRIPSERIGTPDEIAAMVAFLCLPEAGFINGAVIDVNGGELTAP